MQKWIEHQLRTDLLAAHGEYLKEIAAARNEGWVLVTMVGAGVVTAVARRRKRRRPDGLTQDDFDKALALLYPADGTADPRSLLVLAWGAVLLLAASRDCAQQLSSTRRLRGSIHPLHRQSSLPWFCRGG